jgi:hypothetical protein
MVPSDPVRARKVRAERQQPFGLITAGCLVHYAGPGQRTTVAQVGFDRRVQKPEQVYIRELVLPIGETPVDCGWIAEPGMILIVNQSQKGGPGRVLMSLRSVVFAQALPGECIQFHPVSGTVSELTLSSSEDTPITIYAFPG